MCHNAPVSPLRILLAAFAFATFFAPAVAATGILAHLEWADHDGGDHDHGAATAAPADSSPGDDADGHSHALPEIESDPATSRSGRPDSPGSGAHSAPVSIAPEIPSRTPPEGRRHPSDSAGSPAPPPDLIDLHCALLL